MDLELSPLHPQDSNDINPHAVQPGIFQPVVIVQPSECMSHEPPAEPVPDYMCYSKFAMFMCVCLGCAAVYFSRATRTANATGLRRKAARNSQIALILNHLAVVVGIILEHTSSTNFTYQSQHFIHNYLSTTEEAFHSSYELCS